MQLRHIAAATVALSMGAAACAADNPPTTATTVPSTVSERMPVDPSKIMFDTFDGGSIPLDQADAQTILALRDLIPPIDSPAYESALDAADWMSAADIVLAYTDDTGGEWAYPVRILNFHEIVNDEIAGRPVLISYCPLCASGVVYDRRVGGIELSFSNTSALYQSDLVMVDRETGSYWWQVAGRAITGSLTDSTLEPLPSSMRRWSQWSAAHPNGSVLSRLPGEGLLPDPFSDLADRIDNGLAPRDLDTEVLNDKRLSPGTTVVVTDIDGAQVAWPVAPARTFSTEVAGRRVTVTADGTGATIVDSVSGDVLPSRSSLWFAVVAAFPDSVIGSETPPVD